MTIKNYYLAIDIGASSGRHVLGWVENGKIFMEEIYRFTNGVSEKNGHLCWDIKHIFCEVVNGIKKCREVGKFPSHIGIDTWGVDFVLLDEEDRVIGDTVAYRDGRTEGFDTKLYQKISQKDLYKRTGIQKLIFNSIYQLYSIKENNPEYFAKAKSFLMIPEYLNYLLTGIKKNEYTNATTSQLVNVNTNDWDYELFDTLGLPKEIFGKLNMPGTTVGKLNPSIENYVGFQSEVILAPTHDTASAVLAIPSNQEDTIFLSSGTWSLIGVEQPKANCSDASEEHNFTNEGGYEHRYRFLKNIMGLWMMQNIRKELNNKYTFEQLYAFAEEAKDFPSVLDVNNETFLAPQSMIQAIKDYCRVTGQQVPTTDGEVLFCVYSSLARCYANAVEEIETVTGKVYSQINVIGGGCQDVFLNKLTAAYTQKAVYTGPIEATAIGNLVCQMLKNNDFSDLSEARDCIAKSFSINKI